ncbi:MAG: hypothetical protein FJ265_11345 [Planctomycetes bacterium]|nr:hypothetical protein [Planctomycetota bacterium]
MTRSFPFAAGFLALAAFAGAQIPQTLIYTGRFPFVSLGSVYERLNGSISQLSEFEFSTVLPSSGAVARSLLPATGMQCYLGDANNDGNHLKFYNLKTYFENLQIGGLFVKRADLGSVTWNKIFFTVRDNVTTAGKDIEVFTNNGTAPYTLNPGDWVRLLPNGNVEFFLTRAQLQVAAGNPPATGSSVHGAHALLQTAAGDLYYVPVEGGHWVNGNGATPYFAQDGAICKIDAAAITYDASGNVASILPNSARLIIDEVAGGPGSNPLTVRQMVTNSGAMNRDGTPVVAAGIYGKTCGLAFDPNGGTFDARFPDPNAVYTQEPNLLFCSNAGSYAGTFWSTANNGTVASINGVLFGSVTPGVPATGSWLGVQFDYANFQPTVIGFVLVDLLAYQPLLLDQGNFGALPAVATQPTWYVDMHGLPLVPAFVFATLGPAQGQPPASLPLGAYPPVFAPGSHENVFLGGGTVSLGLVVTDPNGYGTLSLPNPNSGAFAGVTFLLQAAAIVNNAFQVSTPVITQML